MKCPVCNKENNDNSKFCGGCGSNLSTETLTGRLDPQTMLEGRYAVVRTLGQGGMGAVYLALDTRLKNMPVAIKEMSTRAVGGDLQAAIESFQKEAQMLISLRHPALPVIYDFFSREENRWYLVMDYIQGDTLKAEMQNRGRIPEAVVSNWATQLCDILEYLHKRKPPVIFRDLKPENIMLTPEGQIKLIDFGIARNFQPGNSADTVAYGSGGFSPPEQYGQDQTDARSDIYALGATLHYLLTGIDPSKGPFRFEPPSRYVEVSSQAELAIMKALELKAENRPQSIAEFRSLLLNNTTVPIMPQGIISPPNSTQPGDRTVSSFTESDTMALYVDQNQILNAAAARVEASRHNAGYNVQPGNPAAVQGKGANRSYWIAGPITAVVVLLLGAGAFWFINYGNDETNPVTQTTSSDTSRTNQSSNMLVLPEQPANTNTQSQPTGTTTMTSQSQNSYVGTQSTLEELNKGEQIANQYDTIRINLIKMLQNLANGQGTVSDYYKTCSTASAERQALLNDAQSLRNRSNNPTIHQDLINMLSYSLEYCSIARQGASCVERNDAAGLDQKLNELQACSERIQRSLDNYKATVQQERSRV